MRRILILLAVCACTAVSLTAAPLTTASVHEDQMIKLPCGRTVKVLSISKVEYSKGVMAVMLRYQTTLSVEERKQLSEEVDDVFKFVVKDVEKQGYGEVILSSNEVPKGIIVTTNHMLNFIFEKGSDGKWTRLNRADFMAAE